MKEIHDFRIIERRQLGEQYFMLVVEHGGKMQQIAPGQFVEIQVPDCNRVMLRRPISVHDVDQERGTISLLIQTVGNGTHKLAELKEGDTLNMVYPLGHGFTITDSLRKVLLVGGGAGIAPLLHLSKELNKRKIHPTILLGGRTADLIPVHNEFEPYGEVKIATDDGSLGHKGLVVEHPTFGETYDMIYTCGPTPMMKAVARSAARHGICCEVSLENMMACGIGACLCCVTDTDDGHKCVCEEGPVFNITKMKKWYEQS